MVTRDGRLLEVARHSVEGHRDLTDLVTPRLSKAIAEIAPAEPAHADDQAAERRRERAREENRRHGHERGDAGRRRQERAPKGDRRGERLRRVELRDDPPAQIADVEGRVRGEDRLLPVIELRQDARPAIQRGLSRRAADLLEQHGALVGPHELEQLTGHAGLRGRLEVPLRRGQKKPRIASHPAIRADEVGLSRPAQSLRLPLPVAGHDGVDAIDRELQRHDAEAPAFSEDRRGHERRRRAQ